MTAPARISQADMERVLKAARAAGWKHVHMTLNLNERTIYLDVADTPLASAAVDSSEEWTDDDI